MPAESSTTSVVAALSVAVAVVGHALVGGGAVPLGVVPPLAALAGVCWLLGEYLAGERLLTVLVLAGVQLFVHVTLDAAHGPMHHGMAMPRGVGGSLMMTAAHLSVLLAGVLAISRRAPLGLPRPAGLRRASFRSCRSCIRCARTRRRPRRPHVTRHGSSGRG